MNALAVQAQVVNRLIHAMRLYKGDTQGAEYNALFARYELAVETLAKTMKEERPAARSAGRPPRRGENLVRRSVRMKESEWAELEERAGEARTCGDYLSDVLKIHPLVLDKLMSTFKKA